MKNREDASVRMKPAKEVKHLRSKLKNNKAAIESKWKQEEHKEVTRRLRSLIEFPKTSFPPPVKPQALPFLFLSLLLNL